MHRLDYFDHLNSCMLSKLPNMLEKLFAHDQILLKGIGRNNLSPIILKLQIPSLAFFVVEIFLCLFLSF